MGIPLKCVICDKEMVRLTLEDGTIKEEIYCPEPFYVAEIPKYSSHHTFSYLNIKHEIIVYPFLAEVITSGITHFWISNVQEHHWDYVSRIKSNDVNKAVAHMNKLVKLKAFL